MTKVVCISDTHGKHGGLTIPKCDLLLHAGDIAGGYRHGYHIEEFTNLQRFLKWFTHQPAEHKILVAGNHDFGFQKQGPMFRQEIEQYKDITYLEDSSYTFNGLLIWGTPWQTIFHDWAFNAPDWKLKKHYELIPDDVDVLISHAPAYGILDKTESDLNVGSKVLKDRIRQLTKLKLHVFGHIHEAYGHRQHYVNASVVNERQRLTNQPIIIELG